MDKQHLGDFLEDKSGFKESLLQNLEQQKNWDGMQMCLFQGFWCPFFVLRPVLSFQKNFKPHDTDIHLVSLPKAGTTWLKALLFSIVNRHCFPIDQSPLLTNNPHDLILTMEIQHYLGQENPDFENMSEPRLFQTHLPYHVLPDSLINSKSKIVYVTRNLLDLFISNREFFLKNRMKPDFDPVPIEEAVDMFCEGIHLNGPFWEHILEYWRASLENPDRVLFLKYEDVKKDPISAIVKIAEFLGMPFSEEEEKRGLIGEISELCSIEKLKNLEINRSGIRDGFIANSSFFRKGEIGDWKNHLSPDLGARIKRVMDEKMSGSGLVL